MHAKQIPTPAQDTPIIDLVKAGNFDDLKEIMEEMENAARTKGEARRKYVLAEMVGERDGRGRTPLHYVFNVNDIKSSKAIAEYLMSKGADVNAIDENKSTPLHFIAGVLALDKPEQGKGRVNETTEMMQCLLAAHKINPKLKANSMMKDSWGYVPFYYYTMFVQAEQTMQAIVEIDSGAKEFFAAYELYANSISSGSDKKSHKHSKTKSGCEIS